MKTFLVKAAATLAVSELIVMCVLRCFGLEGHWLEIILDPLLMLLLALGPLYALFRSEERARMRHERMQAKLQRIIEDLWNASLQTISREDLLLRILEEVLTNSPISIEHKGAIFLKEEGELRMKASVGLSEAVRKSCATVAHGRCMCGRVLASGETVFAEHVDARHDVPVAPDMDHGHYCLPIKSAGQVTGVLTLYTAAGHKRDALEENFLRSVCAIIARIIEGKKQEATLFQFQKMEALNRFAAGIAHDFNNILGAIRGFCGTAMRELPAGGGAAGDLKEICAAVDKGTALTRQLKLFSRQAKDDQEVFDLNDIAGGLREITGRLAGSATTVEFTLTPAPLPVKGNRNQLEQVLLNLTANARDAMPAGGRLTLETSRQEVCFTGPRRCFSAAKLSVSDTGTGMTETVQERIFEPFFTTKEEGKGSGLGLSITHGIIKQHGGEILAHSVAGKGSRFDIYLPLAETSKTE